MNVRARAAIYIGITSGILLAARLIHSVEGGPVLCLFRRITGLPCPSCGMTRAFVALGHRDFHTAIYFNLASPAVYMATWLMLLLGVGELIFARPLRQLIWNVVKRPVLGLTILLMGAAWIVNFIHYFEK